MHTFYIIEDIDKGLWLPEGKGANCRGFTHVEFTNKELPRLFKKKHHAKCALEWWLNGKTHTYHEQDREGEWSESWHTEPQPERNQFTITISEVKLIRV